nr:bifunctional protein-serine/threonine kinase/phosphatase [uncultured Noviherbaspirillum sp.]
MANTLKTTIGQHSDKGRKPANQDFHGVATPPEPQRTAKGIAIAIADGISSSAVSHIASEAAVTSFLDDYYCTSDAWSVRTSAERVLVAANAWLYAQTRQGQGRYDRDRGYVCTLSAMVIKSTTAHIFHVGDTRIYRLEGNALEQLTSDHRVWVSPEQSYLGRALGVDSHVEIDYLNFQVEPGDTFVLATDGVYDHVDGPAIRQAIAAHPDDLDAAAKVIVAEAARRGSTDNLTVQLLRIDALPRPQASEMVQQMSALPFPPMLEARMAFDGYRIVRELHASSRSHLTLATDDQTGEVVVIKAPSIDLRDDPAYLERFLMEEWVARRIDSAHVLKPGPPTRKRNFLYVVTEFIEGQTLAQWMTDHPAPDLEAVRGIVGQVARGLRAFHRLEMLHQDLRPENIMIDSTGTVKIIDFGSTRVAGVVELASPLERGQMLGTALYAAPEYFLGDAGTPRSDLFSLGVIAYQMLTGMHPYGTRIPASTTTAAQRKLVYTPVRHYRRALPAWVDEAIRKAVQVDPGKRYDDLGEFVYDLQHPNAAFLARARPPLIERNPVIFWQGVSLALAVLLMLLALAMVFR